MEGTKAALDYELTVAPGASTSLRVRLRATRPERLAMNRATAVRRRRLRPHHRHPTRGGGADVLGVDHPHDRER